MFTNDYKDIMRSDFEASNKCSQIREFANTKSASNDHKLCMGISVNARMLGLFNKDATVN